MTDAIKGGGAAFPCKTPIVWTEGGVNYEQAQDGMSLRDYFAGQALAGLLANPSYDNSSDGDARLAYELADAMIKAREGK